MSERLTGRIKWYDSKKAFGFMVPLDGGDDILVHANVLHDHGISSVVEGALITCDVIKAERGLQVSEIISIEVPSVDPIRILMEIFDDEEALRARLETTELSPARIKWYDRAKGFGFANLFGSNQDVFIHIELLRAYGFSEVDRGEAVAMKTIEGPRGLIAIEIKHWDEAIS